MKSKKILMVHKYFIPDTPPYASMLNDIANYLSGSKHMVSVYSAQPSYKSYYKQVDSKETLKNGVKVRRIRLLCSIFKSDKINTLDFFYFPIRVFLHILRSRYDVVTVSTAPQVSLGFFAVLACKIKRVKLIYHCMDIHPEIGRLSGEFSNPVVFSVLKMMDNYTLRHSYKVIVLSEDMQNTLVARKYGSIDNISIINNCSLSDYSLSAEGIDDYAIQHYQKSNGDIRLIFAGNIGRFQGLDKLVYAFNQLEESTILELVFLGEGKALGALKSVARHSKIKFYPHLLISQARKLIEESDFGIVSLQNEIINYAFPSKTITYLELGLPIISLVESDSCLSKLVSENMIGFSVEANDIGAINDVFKKISETDFIDNDIKERVKSIYNENFSSEKIFLHWSKLLEST